MASAIVWTDLFAPDFHLPKPLTLRACEVRTKTQYHHVLISLLTLQGNADAADHSSTIEGLVRKQIASAFSARARMASSVKAVMKMNGGTPLSAGP
jgi:hypothetical protein